MEERTFLSLVLLKKQFRLPSTSLRTFSQTSASRWPENIFRLGKSSLGQNILTTVLHRVVTNTATA